MHKRGFGSDNHAPVHPKILKAIELANKDHAPSYGTDHLSEQLEQMIRKLFGETAKAFCVFNGTGANVLAIRSLLNSYQSVLCSDVAHIHVDECGAPEAIAGVKLVPVVSENGKLAVDRLKEQLIRRGDQHYSQVGMLSLTQPTELGTVYSLEELQSLIRWAHSEGLKVHMDGARLAQAAHFLNLSFKELTTDLGVDVLSFGGTKNGFLMGELVIYPNFEKALQSSLFKEEKQKVFYLRKQLCQLPSKTRFIAAQFLAYFAGDLYKKISAHSHQMAKRMELELRGCADVKVLYPVESNAVFASLPKAWNKKLREKYFYYVWSSEENLCRLMMSWDTQIEDIINFNAILRTL